MASRKIEDLDPAFQPMIVAFEDQLAREGLTHFKRCCTRRDQAEQNVLWMQGRKSIIEVNLARATIGLAPITIKQNVKITWRTVSDHSSGLAVDYYIEKDGRYCDDIKVDIDQDRIPDWQEFGAIAERCGLEWGGSWSNPDYPHVQKRRT